MNKLERIVVAIDVFGNPQKVLRRAFLLAEENEASLFIVQAIETPLFAVPDYFGSDKISVDIGSVKKKIEGVIKDLDVGNSVSYQVFVKEGSADDIVLYEAKLLNAQMIVMGAHTKSGKKMRFGTTAQKVAHQSHIPVLIVKNKAKRSYENVIAPTDFEVQSKQSIAFVQNICSSAKIDMVNAYEAFYATDIYTAGAYTLENLDIESYDKAAKTASQNNMKNLRKEMGIRRGKVIEGGLNTKGALLKYIHKGGYDLTVLGSRGTSGALALLGSVAYTLMREVTTDVLVFVPR